MISCFFSVVPFLSFVVTRRFSLESFVAIVRVRLGLGTAAIGERERDRRNLRKMPCEETDARESPAAFPLTTSLSLDFDSRTESYCPSWLPHHHSPHSSSTHSYLPYSLLPPPQILTPLHHHPHRLLSLPPPPRPLDQF